MASRIQNAAQREQAEAYRRMALALDAQDVAPEICTRCGIAGWSHTHCSDGRILCAACRPSTAMDYATLAEEMDQEDRREAAEDAGDEPEED